MISAKRRKVVTLNGECFDVEYHGIIPGSRDGVFHDFRLYDAVEKRDLLAVGVVRGGAKDMYAATVAEYDRREDPVVLNSIRREFDRAKLDFGTPRDASSRYEIILEPSDFAPRVPANDKEIRTYITHKAYWLAYQYPTQPQTADIWGSPILFDETADLEYLGVTQQDIWKNIRRLANQGFLHKVMEGSAAPTDFLLTQYEQEGESVRGLSAEPDDRKFAQLAIVEARKSIPEDDRVHPKVGVVVVKDGSVIASAHRGEFPECHAEYVALEKKLADESLSNAIVYTTLEPCTSRKHPKVPCATRLAERKVARVVIGMLDPDDRISGRGQRALRKAGIKTELFLPDLMSQVEELNRDFIRDRESSSSVSEDDLADKILSFARQVKRELPNAVFTETILCAEFKETPERIARAIDILVARNRAKRTDFPETWYIYP
jgi:pyrimidine deaminase RibD-like protein